MATNTMSESPIAVRFPAWQPEYEAALLETNTDALFGRVEVAEASLLIRREALAKDADHAAEKREIAAALEELQAIKRVRLKFRQNPNLALSIPVV
jgi:hypothetical protein